METYTGNIQKYSAAILKLAEDLRKLSTLRLITFLFSIILIVILANERLLALLLVVSPLCILGFGWVIKRYNQVAARKKHFTYLKEINEHEVLRLKNNLSDLQTGKKFTDSNHPYLSDLDIFGSHSLFQLLNRTTTETGCQCLAAWLSAPASRDVVLERQQAIKELTPKLEWRQDFQASGMSFTNSRSDSDKLLDWIVKPVQLLPRQTKYSIAVILLSLVSTSAAVYLFTQVFITGSPSGILTGITLLSIVVIVNSNVLKRVRVIAEEITENAHQNLSILGGYHSLIDKIESETFHSPKFQDLQSAFRQNGYSAAREINRLKTIMETFKLRGTKKLSLNRNAFYSVFNNLWLLDIYWIIQTEKWKTKNSSFVKSWASSISEFEVLNSLAGFSYSNSSYTFPEINEDPYVIDFEKLGHPLIGSESRVCNDFNLKGSGEIVMITGSNMAGKSTFLRAVGVNLVLALMGAPCCAGSASVSTMKIFTSMRTQDNLEEGVSSFYAELKRIEQLLKLIQSGEAIFFLLDEMFKGTNSQDRYKGGVSLIKQLSELNAFGIISTHDLALARLAGNHMNVRNFSFNSKIRGDEMSFNFTLTDGICSDFNASALMKKSGIKILSDVGEK